MTKRVLPYLLYLAVGAALVSGSVALGTDALHTLLTQNIFTLVLAAFAVNMATLAFVASTVRELAADRIGVFRATRRELRVSMVEQVVYIAATALLLVLGGAPVLSRVFPFSTHIIDGLLSAVLAGTIHNLYDTGNCVFVLLGEGSRGAVPPEEPPSGSPPPDR